MRQLVLPIASPLEADRVERIARFARERIRVIFEPELLPVPRYVADHDGRPRAHSPAQRACWLAVLRQADILFGFDWLVPAELPERAPRVRWVQGTSAGIGELLRRTGLIDADILFTTAAGVHGSARAEFVILGLLYFSRDVARLQRMQAAPAGSPVPRSTSSRPSRCSRTARSGACPTCWSRRTPRAR